MKRSRCVQDDPADERFCVGCRSPARRTVLKVGLGLGVGLWWSGSASTQEVDPRAARPREDDRFVLAGDRKSTRLNSSHGYSSYAVFCLKKKTPRTPSLINETHPSATLSGVLS